MKKFLSDLFVLVMFLAMSWLVASSVDIGINSTRMVPPVYAGWNFFVLLIK